MLKINSLDEITKNGRGLIFGDNLEIMEKMPDNCIDLIATDPPFNSGRNYCINFDSKSQQQAFIDTWSWENLEKEIKIEDYPHLKPVLEGISLMLGGSTTGKGGAMRGYLYYMAPRLWQMHRVLKDTGSLYLHCDDNANSYLRVILDSIFGIDNFCNQIKWYGKGRLGNTGSYFPSWTDTILFYSKNKKQNYFNPPRGEMLPRQIQKLKQGWRKDRKTGKLIIYDKNHPIAKEKIQEGDYVGNPRYTDLTKGSTISDNWVELSRLKPGSVEKCDLGYATQKPCDLYERIIGTSSNTGDIIFDPFCGGGTTLGAAENLQRQWVGVDITYAALDMIKKRFEVRPDEGKRGSWPNTRQPLFAHDDYKIIGDPPNYSEFLNFVKEDVKNNFYNFEKWSVSQLALESTKLSGDGGIDGIAKMVSKSGSELTIVCEVKSGPVSKNHVRRLSGSMNTKNADLAIIITPNEISSGARSEAVNNGLEEFEGEKYPKIQFWHIDPSYFKSPNVLKDKLKLPDLYWKMYESRKGRRTTVQLGLWDK